MSDWSISKRINVLSGILVGAMLLLTATGIGSALRLGQVLGDYKTTAADTLVIVRTQEDALEARGHELRHRLLHDTASADLATSNLAEIATLADDLARLAAEDPGARAQIAGIAAEIGDYRRLFEETLAFGAEEERRMSETAAREAALASALDALMEQARASAAFDTLGLAARVREQVLAARLAFERFLSANGEEEFAGMTRHLDAARAGLAALAGGPPGPARLAASEAAAALDAYAGTAAALRDPILARKAARDSLDALSDDILARLNAALDVEVDRQADLAESGQSVVSTTMALLAAVSLVAVAGGLFFAFTLSRRLRAAIGASVAQMQELAQGNLAIAVTGADRKDELGQMARALEVFRTNAIAAGEAEARRKEAERLQREKDAERDRREAEAAETLRRRAEEERQAVVRRLQASIGTVVDRAAAGDFSGRIGERFAEPEFSRMADAVNLLMANVETGVKEVARVMSNVAAGDLTERMSGSFSGLFADLQASVNETVATLTRVVDDIATGCEAVTLQAGQMTEQSVELARRAEQQAASLEETSAAMEEISATARSSAEGAASANDFARRATGRVDEAGRVVASAVGAMGDIRAASTRIGEIVTVIEGIAFQTNLLALNASVEAARAGSAGKGFAVVATEVRALAQRSSAASQDIKALIDESAAQVNRGVDLVEETGTTLKEIVEGVRQMAGALGDLVTAGREQAAGVQEVTTAISQLDVITQKNAALAERSRDLAGDLRSRAETMEGLVATFRTGARRAGPAGPARSPDRALVDDWQAA